ncbi:MAG: hypothetical protein ACREEE_06135 [Dongiaceae bacterium]
MGDVKRPGFIVGLPLEARLISRAFGPLRPLIHCSGATPSRVAGGVEDLRRQGADCLISCGFAGGIDGSVGAGDVILADAVVSVEHERFGLDGPLIQRLQSALQEAGVVFRTGGMAGVDRIADSPAGKQALAAATGAIAVDMESHVLARAGGGLPIAVLRVVVDPAERAIPAAVLGAMDGNGNIQPLELLAGLARRPSEIGKLLSLARDHMKARHALKRAVAAVAGVFGES